jgi:hypothetical protein
VKEKKGEFRIFIWIHAEPLPSAIGHLVPSLAHAVSLRMEPKEIIPADFEAVNAAEPGLLAKAYERLCHARMTDEDIDARLSFDIAICEAQLDHRLDITTFPDPAAAACLDMAVNLGVSGLMTYEALRGGQRSGLGNLRVGMLPARHQRPAEPVDGRPISGSGGGV